MNSSFPTPFLRALQDDRYDPGESDFTTTQILARPQRTHLLQAHSPDQSAYQGFMALLGTAVHNILEEYCFEDKGEMAERRLYMEIEGWKLGGQVDFYEEAIKTVFDYKVYAGIVTEPKEEHISQVQINGLLCEHNGFAVEHVSVVYVMREWSYRRSVLDPSYPSTPFAIFTVPYNKELARALALKGVREHAAGKQGSPRPCTAEEQWRKPDQWARMKNAKAKRASKLYSDKKEAEKDLKAGEILQYRPGEAVFCEQYCGLKLHCAQYHKEKATK